MSTNQEQAAAYQPGRSAPTRDPAPSGQQLQAILQRQADALTAIRKDLELRKLALDQACNVIASTNAARTDGPITFHNPIALARDMHAFLVEGAVEKPGS